MGFLLFSIVLEPYTDMHKLRFALFVKNAFSGPPRLYLAAIGAFILLNSVAVAVAVQLATEMALNSEVGRLFGWLFVRHTFWKPQ